MHYFSRITVVIMQQYSDIFIFLEHVPWLTITDVYFTFDNEKINNLLMSSNKGCPCTYLITVMFAEPMFYPYICLENPCFSSFLVQSYKQGVVPPLIYIHCLFGIAFLKENINQVTRNPYRVGCMYIFPSRKNFVVMDLDFPFPTHYPILPLLFTVGIFLKFTYSHKHLFITAGS